MRPSHRGEGSSALDGDAPIPLDAAALWALGMPTGSDRDKYRRGTVLVVGGSPTTPGAAILAGLAALRIGAGRLRIATASEVATGVAVAVPEAMVVGLVSGRGGLRADDALAEAVADVDAVVVGPGMVADEPPVDLLQAIGRDAPPEAVVVIDAIALAAFARLSRSSRTPLALRAVLTPNRQEIAQLAAGPHAAGCPPLAEVARRTAAVVSSFGAVSAPDGRAWTAGDAPGLGTSGSGDVLAGLVGGAAARCGDPATGACWGTFAHMEAGRRLAREIGPIGYLARELVDVVPACLPAPDGHLTDSHGHDSTREPRQHHEE